MSQGAERKKKDIRHTMQDTSPRPAVLGCQTSGERIPQAFKLYLAPCIHIFFSCTAWLNVSGDTRYKEPTLARIFHPVSRPQKWHDILNGNRRAPVSTFALAGCVQRSIVQSHLSSSAVPEGDRLECPTLYMLHLP